MSTITTRSGKGSPLTNNEIDDNFTNLNTDKYQSGDTAEFAGLTSTADISLGDNIILQFGASNDLQIYHNGLHSYVDDAGTGNLKIRSSGSAIQFQTIAGVDMLYANTLGAVDLYYAGTGKKLATTSTGIDVTGTAEMDTLSIGGTAVTATAAELNYNDITTLGTVEASKTVTADANGDVLWGDGDKALFGASSDLEIYHDGANSIIRDAGTGGLVLAGSQIVIKNALVNEAGLLFTENGSIELYYDDVKKLETTTGGVTVTGTVTANAVSLADNATYFAGTGNDVEIFYNGTNGYVRNVTTGLMVFDSPSGCILQYGSASKLTTETGGVAVTGTLSATGDVIAYYSDDRLKNNLGKIENALEKVESLEGFYYEANEKAQELGYEVKREVGISAQSVEKVMPEVVAPAPIDEQYLTVKYERLVPLLIESIKELSAEVKKLKGE